MLTTSFTIQGCTLRAAIVFSVVVLVAGSAIAAQETYKGRTLDLSDGGETQQITRIVGAQYNVAGSSADIVTRAQGCLNGRSWATSQSGDPQTGQLQVAAAVNYKSMFNDFTLKSEMTLMATDGAFQLTETNLVLSQGGSDTPLTRQAGSFDKVMDALVGAENELVDCLYR